MSGLILQPCKLSIADRHRDFMASVTTLRRAEDIQDFMPADEYAALVRSVGGQEFALWGARAGRKSTFAKIVPGMRCLFIGDKRAYADLTVLHAFSRPLPQLARHIWPAQGEDDEPWELVMALSPPRPIDLDYAVVKSQMQFEQKFVQRKLFVYTEPTENRRIDLLINQLDQVPAAPIPLWQSIRSPSNDPEGRPNNPNWAWEEEILAFRLLRQTGKLLGSHDPRVQTLSQQLQTLTIHPPEVRGTTFRNPNGVSRKIADLQTNRPGYRGKSTSSSRIDRLAWQHLASLSDKELEVLADAVLAGARVPEPDDLESAGQAFGAARAWFLQHAGEILPREAIRLPEHSELLIGAQGGKVIFKPANSDTALSIQVLINSPYGPEEVHHLPSLGPDGNGWLLRYHREQQPDMSEADAESLWTNQALKRNMETGHPVGVLIQTSRRPSTFLVKGLGYVVEQESRRFWVASHNDLAEVKNAVSRHLGTDTTNYWKTEDRLTPPEPPSQPPKTPSATFDPAQVEDERERVRADIFRRQGQGKFRTDVLRAYGYQCAVTNYDVRDVLEAAHILPYRGPAHNDVRNGILLRADLHTLMDRQLLRIDPETRRVVLHPSLHDSPYAELNDAQIREPLNPASQPHRRYLEAAWDDGNWTGG